MTGGVICSVLSALLAVPPATDPSLYLQAPAYQDQATTKFRSSVDMVSVAAIVRDRKGRFVSDLDREDFEVMEGGKRRSIVDFRAMTDGPVKVALLVDVSGSMRVNVEETRQAAAHLFYALRPDDQAAVYSFDTQLRQVSKFTADRQTLEAAVAAVDKPYGQTSLYDAIAETSRAIATVGRNADGLVQRSAVVVLTDGIDTRSRLKPAEVSAIASGIDVPVYILAVMSPIDDPRNSEEPVPAGALQELARWTGGDLFTSSAPAHASVAARRILDELRHQYLLAFEASPAAGWRPLEVRTRGRGLTVRARTGYTAGSGTE